MAGRSSQIPLYEQAEDSILAVAFKVIVSFCRLSFVFFLSVHCQAAVAISCIESLIAALLLAMLLNKLVVSRL